MYIINNNLKIVLVLKFIRYLSIWRKVVLIE